MLLYPPVAANKSHTRPDRLMTLPEARSAHTPTPSLTQAPMIQCGRYELIAKLGHGGMADVFLAVAGGSSGFRKLGVIKRMHPELLEEEHFREMFMDEARLAARLNHANIVQTQEVDTASDGVPYIAMEYLEGEPLNKVVREAVQQGKPMSLPLVVTIITGVLDALHYAHTLSDFDGLPLNVVHRDVSPANLFVTYEGSPKLLDFGIAKASTQVAETRTGHIKGKLSYMSPEQARSQDIDGRADVWSAGVVLWECLSQRRLFRENNDIDTIRRVLAGDVPPLEDEDVNVPEELSLIVEKALYVDRNQRWGSAAEMRDALSGWCRKSGVQPASKTELSDYMKDLFSSRITVQRERIALALQSFDTRQRNAQSGQVPNLGVYDTGAVSVVSAPVASSQRLIMVLVALLIAAFGALAGIFLKPQQQSSNDDDNRPRAEAPDPAPLAPTVTAAEPVAIEPARTVMTDPTADAVDLGISAETDEGSATPRRRRWVAMRATSRATETAEVPPQDTTPATMAADRAVVSTGRLSIVTTPWSEVYLGGRRIGQTPLIGIELPEGRHVLLLKNPEEHIETRYPVRIEANQHERVRISLR